MPSKGKLKLKPEFEDLLHLFGRMKEAPVRSLVEELEKERRRAEEVAREYVALKGAYRAEWRREWLETGRLVFRLLSDVFVFGVFWCILWLVHAIQVWLPIEGRAAVTLATMHEYTTISLYFVLAVSVLWDMIEARLARRRRG